MSFFFISRSGTKKKKTFPLLRRQLSLSLSHPSTRGLPAACSACTLSTTDCRETSCGSKRVPEAVSDHCLSANESRKKTGPNGRGLDVEEEEGDDEVAMFVALAFELQAFWCCFLFDRQSLIACDPTPLAEKQQRDDAAGSIQGGSRKEEGLKNKKKVRGGENPRPS